VTSPRANRRWGAIVAALLIAACATARDGLDVTQLPADVRPDYALFARRCSKCHQLARPLHSGIRDDAMWADYVERMRRQPGSGISPSDTKPILRFLHYYSHDYARHTAVSLAPDRRDGPEGD
jgi:hypothetical protein